MTDSEHLAPDTPEPGIPEGMGPNPSVEGANTGTELAKPENPGWFQLGHDPRRGHGLPGRSGRKRIEFVEEAREACDDVLVEKLTQYCRTHGPDDPGFRWATDKLLAYGLGQPIARNLVGLTQDGDWTHEEMLAELESPEHREHMRQDLEQKVARLARLRALGLDTPENLERVAMREFIPGEIPTAPRPALPETSAEALADAETHEPAVPDYEDGQQQRDRETLAGTRAAPRGRVSLTEGLGLSREGAVSRGFMDRDLRDDA